MAAAPKVVLLPSDQVPGQAASGVEVGHVLLLVGVDGHQHPLRVSLPLKDDLLIGEDHIAIAAVAQGGTALLGLKLTKIKFLPILMINGFDVKFKEFFPCLTIFLCFFDRKN